MSVSLSLRCPTCQQVFLAANCSPSNLVQCAHCSSQFRLGNLAVAEVAPVGTFGKLDGDAEKREIEEQQKSKQSVSMGIVAIPVVLTLLAGYFVIFSQSGKEAASSVSPLEELNEPRKPTRYFDEAFVAVKRMVGEESWMNLVKDVREPERVQPLMNWFYTKVPIKPVKLVSYDTPEYFEVNGEKFVRMNIVTDDFRRAIAVLEQTPEGFKLDWETSSGVHQLQWDDFRDTKPTKKTAMRVEVRRSSLPDRYFHAANLSPENAMGIRIWSDKRSASLFAVIPLNSPLAEQIQETLDSGAPTKNWSQEIKMMLEISFPQSREPEDRVEVASFVQKGWLISGN